MLPFASRLRVKRYNYTLDLARSPAKPCEALRSPAKPCEALRSPAKPCEALRSPAKPCEALRSPAKPCEALRSPAGPACAHCFAQSADRYTWQRQLGSHVHTSIGSTLGDQCLSPTEGLEFLSLKKNTKVHAKPFHEGYATRMQPYRE